MSPSGITSPVMLIFFQLLEKIWAKIQWEKELLLDWERFSLQV